MTAPRGLSGIAMPMLEQLLAAVEQRRLEAPFSEADLIDNGFRGSAADVVAAVRGADQAGVAVALRVAIAERVHRPPPRLDLVWTGPETRASTTRDTRMVVQQLFDSAQRSVIVAGYSFDNAEMLQPLHRAMKERSVDVTLFVDIKDGTKSADPHGFATKTIDKLFRKVWTFGAPKPAVYYDPRTLQAGPIAGRDWISLHAKCIVVDDERAFITSANFTGRALTRNIEAGVLIEDIAFSEELAGHWRQLVGEGLLSKYLG